MAPQKSMSPYTWGLLALLSLLWGGTFLSVRIVLDELGPLTLVAHRVGWASLVLWGVVLVRRDAFHVNTRILFGFLGMGLLNNAVPFTLQAWGQLHIESGLTAILNAGTAIWGVLIAATFFVDERLTLARLLGVTFGFLGVATAIGLAQLASFDPRSLAQMAVVASTISYAFAGVWARKMLSGLSPFVQAAGMLTASSIVMIPLAWAVEGPMILSLSAATWAGIAYVTLFATAGAYILYYRVLDLAGSGNLMLCTLLIAPLAIILGALFLGETLEPRALLGFGLLALGLLILNGTLRMPRTKSASP